MLKKTRLLSTLLIFFSIINITFAQTSSRIIDLTHAFGKDTLHWPTTHPFQLHKIFAGKAPRGYYVAVNDYSSAEHAGTHMDAPCHFAKGHACIADILPSKLIGPAIVVDVSKKVGKDRDYLISVADLKAWETEHGKIPHHAIILLRTGFSKFWSNSELYLGTRENNANGLMNLHFPGLSSEAAGWLIDKGAVKAIGIDTVSIDFGQSKNFMSHRTLGEHDIPIFENLADLSQLPATGFSVYALPMKIAGGTGAPLRIVAVLNSR